MIGGRSFDKLSSDIVCVNLTEGKSGVLKRLPFGICAHASAIVNDNIFIFGGTDGAKFLDSLYIYEILSGRLSKAMLPKDLVPPLLAPALCESTTSSGSLVLFGGSTYENEIDTFYVIDTNYYNSSKNSKEVKESLKE